MSLYLYRSITYFILIQNIHIWRYDIMIGFTFVCFIIYLVGGDEDDGEI